MDLTDTIAPKSDQLNSDDLVSGPITVTITEVSRGSVEQPVNIHLVEFPKRAYRPSKSMRRVLVHAWGKDSSEYVGKRLTLYRNPEIKFGGEAVGGIEISHLSDIEGPLRIALTAKRGKRKPFIVEPLPDAALHITPELVSAATTVEELRAMWNRASPEIQQLITAKVTELKAAGTPQEQP